MTTTTTSPRVLTVRSDERARLIARDPRLAREDDLIVDLRGLPLADLTVLGGTPRLTAAERLDFLDAAAASGATIVTVAQFRAAVS